MDRVVLAQCHYQTVNVIVLQSLTVLNIIGVVQIVVKQKALTKHVVRVWNVNQPKIQYVAEEFVHVTRIVYGIQQVVFVVQADGLTIEVHVLILGLVVAVRVQVFVVVLIVVLVVLDAVTVIVAVIVVQHLII